MALPQAVVEQGRAADEALDALEQAQAQGDTATATLEELVADSSEQTPAPGEEQGIVEEEAQDPAPVAEDWEQKFKTLQGKYNAEVSRATQERDRAIGQVDAMSSLLAERAAAPPAQQPEVPTTPAHLRYLKEEEVADFDESVLDMHRRIAQGVAEDIASRENAELRTQVQQLSEQLGAQESDEFWDRVDSLFPGASQLNASDANFHLFLNQTEPLSGQTYRYLGQVAFEAGDVMRMAQLLQDYYEASGMEIPGLEAAPTTEESPGKPAPQVKPSQGRQRPQVSASSKKVIKESAMAKFYQDVARGRYRDKPELAKQYEEEIMSAMEEGRIVPG